MYNRFIIKKSVERQTHEVKISEKVLGASVAHTKAMNDMRSNMTSLEAMNGCMNEKRKTFDALQDDNG
jgi:hypothetical protein